MRQQLKIRMTRAEDVEEVAEWLLRTKNNLFDPGILEYPTMRSITAYDDHGNVAHLPSQQALFLESLAVKPGASPLEAAPAFRDLVKGQQLLASSFGIREVYFVCKDEDVVKVAEGHGFERIVFPVVRLKL
jgi:hypothetical protein